MAKTKISNWKIPLYKIYTDDEDIELVRRTISRGTSWAIGQEIEEFETSIKNYVGTNYCLTLNSGTSALHAVHLAYGLGENDEVIVPSFTFISTANSVLFVNANPVFADIESTTLGLDPSSIIQKISSKTKVIMPADYAGISCNIHEIQKIAKENNLILIQDSAESIGSSVNGKKTGSFADATIFSFAGNKILTTGEGGAIVTNSKEIFEKIKLLRSHGRIDGVGYFENPETAQYVQLGYNWRMSSITAALGISQLEKLDKMIKMRQDNAKFISSKLSKLSQIILPAVPKGHEHTYQFYSIRLLDKSVRDGLKNYLTKKRIMTKIYFNPIHLTPFYQKRFSLRKGFLPNTEAISEQILSLPLYPNMTNEEKNYLIDSIYEFFESIKLV